MIERAFIEYFVNALWQVPLLAAAGWLLVWAIRPGPLLQHRLWLAILGLLLLLPLHGIGKSGSLAIETRHNTLSNRNHLATGGELNRLLPANDGQTARRLQSPFRMTVIRLTPTDADWLIGLYLAMVAFGLSRIVRAWWAARRIVKCSRATTIFDRDRVVFEDCAVKLGVKLPQLRESDRISSPSIVGMVTPVLLLPEKFLHHSAHEIEAALCHELAHIARRDYLMNLVCEIAALPVVWNPATHCVQQRIRRTREMVCDAMAARQMQSEIEYAKCLLALARSMPRGRSMAAEAQVLGLFSHSILEERVMQLMKRKSTTSTWVNGVRVASGAAVMIVATAMAAMFYVTPTMAQSQAPAPPDAVHRANPNPQPQPTSPAHKSAAASRAITHGDSAHVRSEKGTYIYRWKGADGKPFTMVNGKHRDLTPEEQRRIEAEVQRQMQKMQRQIKVIELPKIQQRVKDATAEVNSPEFQKQMQKMQEQMKAMDLSKIQQQVKDATAEVNSPEFQKQMQKMQEQMKAMELSKIQQQVKDATAEVNGPEFQRQMQELQEQMKALELPKIPTVEYPPAK